jgi:hypothetical protein
MKQIQKTSTALVAIAAAALITPQIANAALMAHWKMDETTGNTAADSSGNSRDTATGTVDSWVTGSAGNAASLPRLQLDATDSEALRQANGSVTVSAWVNTYATTGDNQYSGIVGYEGTGGDEEPYGFKMNQNDELQWGVSKTFVGFNDFHADESNGTWTHIVGTFDTTTGVSTLYINGAQQGTANPGVNAIGSSSRTFSFGRYEDKPGFDFDGSIDDVQVYDTALSSSDVSSLFANPGLNLTTIPEPSTTALLGLGGFALILRRRK